MRAALDKLAGMRRHVGPLLVMVGGLFLMLVIFATAPKLEPQDVSAAIPIIDVAYASPSRMRMRVTAHGTVVPKTESQLVPEVAGVVVSVSEAMVAGGFFHRGDVLVGIDRLDYEVAVVQAQSRLASAESELASARRAFKRQEELVTAQSGSESKKDDARNRMVAAEAALREAQALVRRAERDLDRTRLVAPYDGRVRSERVDPGQFVSRGETIANLYSVDFAEVRLPVHDEDLAFLPLPLDGALDDGDRLDLVLRSRFAGREHAWPARIVRTEGEIDPKTRMVNLVAEVPSPYRQRGSTPPLTAGLFVEAEIFGREFEDVTLVPRSALQGDDRVYVVDGEGRLTERNVNVLRVVGDDAYLQGLGKGDAICTSCLPGDGIGQRVRTAAGGLPEAGL